MYKVKPLINYFNNKINSIQIKNFCLTNRLHKYGIKLYMLTEPAGLVIKSAIYTQVFNNMWGKGHAANVVFRES